MPKIDILLATYNGARYLPDLLASLASQSEADWRLIARDDGSSDGSLDVVRRWAADGGHALQIIDDGDRALGASASFGRLFDASDAPYFMFCDQDDVWLPDKLSRLLAEARSAEVALGADFPILIHSDLRVVDEALAETASSFWALQGFRTTSVPNGPAGDAPRRSLLVQNTVTGCATLGNAALRDLAAPIPGSAIMHDWWLTMVAGHLGEIRGIGEPTILYRQHGSNTIGARESGPLAVAARALREPRETVQRTRKWLAASRAQTTDFVARYGDRLDKETREALATYADLGSRSFIERKAFLFRHGIWPQSRTRTAIMLAII